MQRAKYIPPGISLKGGSLAVAFVSQLPGNPEKIFSVPEAAKHLQKTISFSPLYTLIFPLQP